MSKRLTIGVLYASDSAHLPESGEGFTGLTYGFKGHNDIVRLIDARKADIIPLLITPEYLSRDWRYDFGRFDVIYNSLADPDLHGSSLLVAISALADVRTPLVNDPRYVIRTRRDIAAGTLVGIDELVVPKTIRLEGEGTPSSKVAERGMSYPLLVRNAGSHTGVGLLRVEAPGDLDAAFDSGAISKPAYISEFIDCRGADGLYRKMRLMVCGDTMLMRHHLFSDQWLINAAAQKFMEDRPDLLEIERVLAAEPTKILPPKSAELMTRIKRRIGLDYFGIDCAPMPDGRLAIFEINAVMNMLPASRHPVRGPFTVAAIGRIAEVFNRLLHQRASDKAKKPMATARSSASPKAGRARTTVTSGRTTR